MEGIIGHTSIVALFDRLLQNGQLGHAYCLVGPAHVGKYTLACSIAATYLRTSVSQLTLHPDIYQLSPEQKENGKIKIEAVRQCRDFLSHTSVHGHGLVVIIDDAHTLTDEAANALLKSIEEPPEKTVFLLVTPFETRLPQTIHSRCQQVQCSTMSTENIVQVLEARGVASDVARQCSVFADGRIGIALMCAQSMEVRAQMEIYHTQSESLHSAPLYEKIQLVGSVCDDETGVLSEQISQWCVADMGRIRTTVLQTGQCDVVAARYVCQYPQTLDTLRTNANKQLTLEQFVF